MRTGYQSLEHGILYSSTPFSGAVEVKRFIVLHDGPNPIPGTEEARLKGCICPGKIGDKDRWGFEGYTVDELCPLHGREARIKLIEQFRLASNRNELLG